MVTNQAYMQVFGVQQCQIGLLLTHQRIWKLITTNGGIFYSLDSAIDEFDPDAIVMLRIQSERMEASFFPTEREYSRIWGLNKERISRLRSNAVVLHPGPMNRGLEIDAASADSDRSRILNQVSNGVSIRMAVLFSLLAGERGES